MLNRQYNITLQGTRKYMPVFGKKKGITKIRAEISETQASKTAEKSEENQALVFDDTNKSDKTLV